MQHQVSIFFNLSENYKILFLSKQTHNKINGFNNSNNKTQENVFKIQTNGIIFK